MARQLMVRYQPSEYEELQELGVLVVFAQGAPGGFREARRVVQFVDRVDQGRMARRPRTGDAGVHVGGRPELFRAESGLLGEDRGMHAPLVGAAGASGHPCDDDLAIDVGEESVPQQSGPQGEHA